MWQIIKHYSSFLSYDLIRIYCNHSENKPGELLEHLRAAAQWICRAQDATPDGGVAKGYSLIYHPYFRRKGWFSSYPETTGYIIPTMFDYAHLAGDQKIYDRAVRMADWECEVQMESGAVQGGTIDQKAEPVIFNTGQVIFGWLRAYQETKNERYSNSAIRAAKFMVNNQDPDGAWRRYLSIYVDPRAPFHAYDTKAACALFLLGSYFDDASFKRAATKNIEFTLDRQLENGWFEYSCLNDQDQPLLHTIAYCLYGILEVAILLRNELFISKVKKAADALMEKVETGGGLSGRFNKKWEPAVSWSCLTGNAQISIIWGKLLQITGERKYLESVQNMNRYLMKVQLMRTNNANILGGLTGSYPIHGDYAKFQIVSWGVKFLMDSLMLEISINNNLRGKDKCPEIARP